MTSVLGFALFRATITHYPNFPTLHLCIRLKIFFTVCKNIATIQEKAKPESICQHHKWDPVRQLQLEINDPVILGYVYRILYYITKKILKYVFWVIASVHFEIY